MLPSAPFQRSFSIWFTQGWCRSDCLPLFCCLTSTCASFANRGSGLPGAEACPRRKAHPADFSGFSSAASRDFLFFPPVPCSALNGVPQAAGWPSEHKLKPQIPLVTKYFIQFIEQYELKKVPTQNAFTCP